MKTRIKQEIQDKARQDETTQGKKKKGTNNTRPTESKQENTGLASTKAWQVLQMTKLDMAIQGKSM